MWRSVPQIPVRSTRISTSLMPIFGTSTSSNQRPGSRRLFTRALILLPSGPRRPEVGPRLRDYLIPDTGRRTRPRGQGTAPAACPPFLWLCFLGVVRSKGLIGFVLALFFRGRSDLKDFLALFWLCSKGQVIVSKSLDWLCLIKKSVFGRLPPLYPSLLWSLLPWRWAVSMS